MNHEQRNAALQAAIDRIAREDAARMEELEGLSSTAENLSLGSQAEVAFGMDEEKIKAFTGFSLQAKFIYLGSL